MDHNTNVIDILDEEDPKGVPPPSPPAEQQLNATSKNFLGLLPPNPKHPEAKNLFLDSSAFKALLTNPGSFQLNRSFPSSFVNNHSSPPTRSWGF